VGRVVLEKVSRIFDIAERVVHRDHSGTVFLAGGAADEAADAAETGNAHFDHL